MCDIYPIAPLENVMSKKNHSPGPEPAGNQPRMGTGSQADQADQDESGEHDGAKSAIGLQEEDPKHRVGDFTGKADHARQQPGPKNDGGTRHGEDAG